MAVLLNKEKMKMMKSDLDNFWSTFEFDTTNLTKDRVRSIIKELEDDRENTTKSKVEDIKITNFLSYLYFLLEDHEHALQLVGESLQKDPDNIIANANKARISLETGEVSEVEEIISKLQDLEKRSDYKKRKCYAEAELAYAYARSGSRYNERAVEMFRRILNAYPTEYTWQFGLGLTLLKRNRLIPHPADSRNEKTTIEAAKSLQSATESNDRILSAHAYLKLGKALFIILKKGYRNLPPEIKNLRGGGGGKECFEKALEICPEEPLVLQVCGQFARYRNEIERSETLLRKSLRIKPSCRGYNHLALTLKRKIEQNHPCIRGRRSPHPPNVERRSLRHMIKSPLKVRVHPQNKLLVEAINFINEAEKMSPGNLNMIYEKGILYRMLGETANAVEVFKQIVSKRKCLPTKTLMTTVYEQLGLCLLELSDSEEVPDKKTKYKKDGESHLKNAFQLQSEIVANDPQFKEAWNSYSTLKELLSDESGRKPRQLAVLHMLMGDHRDSIAIYKELMEKDKMEPDDCKNMLECYMKSKRFEECVTLLSSLECTTIFARLPQSLIFDVYINGAFHAYSTDNVQPAYRLFRRALQAYGMFGKAIGDQTEADEEEDTKDILILHSCTQDWSCRFPRDLGTILEDCTGLRYTINTDNVLRNANTTKSMVSMMQKISCIIIITHDSADKYDRLYVNHAAQMSSEKGRHRVLVVSDDKCNVPDVARTMPFIRMPPPLGDVTIRTPSPLEGAMQPFDKIPDQLPEIQIEWVKEFFHLLKDQYRFP